MPHRHSRSLHRLPRSLSHPVNPKGLCRRMYDCIIGESPVLPANVSLASVLEGCSSEVTGDVLDVLPTSGQLNAAALAPAGEAAL